MESKSSDPAVSQLSLKDHQLHDLALSIHHSPEQAPEIYSQILSSLIEDVPVLQECQSLILQMVIFATRPLRLLEIAAVLDFLDVTKDGQYGDTRSLISISCGPLLAISKDDTVSTLHDSFVRFLTDSKRTGRMGRSFPVIDSATTHRWMTLLCIKYLLSDSLSSWRLCTEIGDRGYVRESTNNQRRQLELQYPFLGYARQLVYPSSSTSWPRQ